MLPGRDVMDLGFAVDVARPSSLDTGWVTLGEAPYADGGHYLSVVFGAYVGVGWNVEAVVG